MIERNPLAKRPQATVLQAISLLAVVFATFRQFAFLRQASSSSLPSDHLHNIVDEQFVGVELGSEIKDTRPSSTDNRYLHDSNERRLSRLPLWMQEYFAWHNKTHTSLSPSNWNNHTKLLILHCLNAHKKCGGAADRLKPIPLLILAAARSQRLLLIRWSRPCPLQEFLVPSILNWTVPDYIDQDLGENYHGPDETLHVFNVHQILPRVEKSTKQIVTALIQWHDGGQLVYDAAVNGTDEFRTIYHDLFRSVFRPSPAVATLLQTSMDRYGLVPGEYSVAQYRAFYRERQAPPTEDVQRELGINAAKCGSTLRPGGPVYFASDSVPAVDAVRQYAQQTGNHVVTLSNPELLHLDKPQRANVAVSDYYPIFVDLYLMGNGRCMSYGDGGFARFGLILSYNHTCENRHWWRHNMIPCNWSSKTVT